MSPQPEERRSPGHRRKTFDQNAIRRMLAAREDGLTNAEIGRRFGCDGGLVTKLIGPKPQVRE
jgi:hypothetical protein